MSIISILILSNEHSMRAVHISTDFWRWSESIGNSVLVSSALLLYEHILLQDVSGTYLVLSVLLAQTNLILPLAFLLWRLFRLFQIQSSWLGLYNKMDLKLLYLTKSCLFIFIQQHGHKVKADGAYFKRVQYPDCFQLPERVLWKPREAMNYRERLPRLKAQVAKHPWLQCKIIAFRVLLLLAIPNLLNKCFILYDLRCFLQKVQIIGLV